MILELLLGSSGDDRVEHDWRTEVELYDLPDPDPRNPIAVDECTGCELKRHRAKGIFRDVRYVRDGEDVTESLERSDKLKCKNT